LLQAARALSAWGATLYGFVAVLALTPLAGYAALALPLAPRELALGLAVFCCMPTTLSSGVSLTQARAPLLNSTLTLPSLRIRATRSLQALARGSAGALIVPGVRRLRWSAAAVRCPWCRCHCQATARPQPGHGHCQATARPRVNRGTGARAARRWAATRRWRCC
jgi:hypothetical protein